jgi:hypothetical protein
MSFPMGDRPTAHTASVGRVLTPSLPFTFAHKGTSGFNGAQSSGCDFMAFCMVCVAGRFTSPLRRSSDRRAGFSGSNDAIQKEVSGSIGGQVVTRSRERVGTFRRVDGEQAFSDAGERRSYTLCECFALAHQGAVFEDYGDALAARAIGCGCCVRHDGADAGRWGKARNRSYSRRIVCACYTHEFRTRKRRVQTLPTLAFNTHTRKANWPRPQARIPKCQPQLGRF